ncbi:MAG: sigma 54-interacting transcriptional regulator [Clostridia bacterium]|nr:sigma 54-interacting transcriptional regulator [Clostridia bacterium]
MTIQELAENGKDILDNLAIAVSICDLSGNFVTMNRAYEQLFGIHRKDYIGRHVSTRNTSDEKSFHMMVLNTKQEYSGAKFLTTKSHNRYSIWAEAKPLFYQGEMLGSIVTLIDFERANKMINEMSETKQIISDSLVTDSKYSFSSIITNSDMMKSTLETAKVLALTPVTVLLRGESGTGKEMFAHAIHNASTRRGKPFLRVNCASIAESLLESILFGYTGNAFTGAKKGGQVGLFEAANHGTLFLDEIGDISSSLQVKLLRVLQEHEIVRVGDVKPIPIDVRIISATNVNLEEKMAQGAFREDLYYRLSIFPIYIPPLRERHGDIRLLAEMFVEKAAHEYSKNISEIDESYYKELERHSWPGNIRELENAIVRSVLICQSQRLTSQDFLLRSTPYKANTPSHLPDKPVESYDAQFSAWEADVCRTAYEASGRNKTRAAKALDISVRSFFNKARKYDID